MKKLVGGNWKIYCDLQTFQDLNFNYHNANKLSLENVEIIIAIPHIYLGVYNEFLPLNVSACAQNVSIFEEGAYTGEVTAKMLKEFKVRYVLLGHSERYMYFNETYDDVHKKLKIALKYNIRPVLCIGEPKELRTGENNEKKQYLKFIETQLKGCIQDISDVEMDIAYEPIWAIGASKPASNSQIEEAVHKIRYIMGTKNIKGRIIYGGSVTSKNSDQISKISGVDGVLVGKSSIDSDFFKIAQSFIDDEI